MILFIPDTVCGLKKGFRGKISRDEHYPQLTIFLKCLVVEPFSKLETQDLEKCMLFLSSVFLHFYLCHLKTMCRY